MSEIVNLDSDGFNLFESLITAKTFVDRWSKEYAAYREQLFKMVGEKPCDLFYKGSRIASVSVVEPNRFNSEAFKTEHPALYSRYLVPGASVARLVPAKAFRAPAALLEVSDG